jgi:hypothetical protein
VRLDAAARTRTVESLIRVIGKWYVFPDVGEKINDHLRSRLQSGAYDAIDDGESLARVLTADVRAINDDRHLRVEYSPSVLPPERENPLEIPPEEKEDFRRGLRLNNYGLKKVEVLDGNVGYVRLDFFAPTEFAADTMMGAMAAVSATDALILDLRHNGGALGPDAIPFFASYFFREPVRTIDVYWRHLDQTFQGWTYAVVPGPRYLDKPVYILTSPRTFSGAEEFAFDMKNLRRGVVVGEATGGGAHPGGTRRVDDHFSIWVPFGRSMDPVTKQDWEGRGVQPDVAVPAARALEKAHRLAIETLKEAATDPALREALQGVLDGLVEKEPQTRKVRFELAGHPEAKEVAIAGTFNFWSSRGAKLTREGDRWVGEVELEPGRHMYKFVVDGAWILDPANPETGREGEHVNSLVVVE